VSLVDAAVGETVLALPFSHHAVSSPFYATGPIYIREDAEEASLNVNEIPQQLKTRTLSIRAYNKSSMMINAKICNGGQLNEYINLLFNDAKVDYLHIHFAAPGCYSCAVYRV